MFLVNHNSPLLSALMANECLRFVSSHRVTFYITQYVTKHSAEDEEAFSNVLAAFTRYNARAYAQSHDGVQPLAAHSEDELEARAHRFEPGAEDGGRFGHGWGIGVRRLVVGTTRIHRSFAKPNDRWHRSGTLLASCFVQSCDLILGGELGFPFREDAIECGGSELA